MIFTILLVVVFVLEARGAFLTFLVLSLYNGSILRLVILAPVVLISMFFLISINRFSFDYRLFEWSNIISNLDQVPFLGFGLQQYQYHSFTSNLYAHNWALDYILGFGIIGAIVIVISIIGFHNLIKNKLTSNKNAVFALPAVYYINGLTQGDAISSLLGVLFVIIVGIKTYKQDRKKYYETI